MTTMVDIKNLTKNFGHFTAVNNISFSVAKGEVLGFLGPNGAGKSTTMKMITGFLTPDTGTVNVMGADIADNPVAVKKHIGYLPEGAPAYPDMTPMSFLEFIADIRGLGSAEKKQRIESVIEKINLEKVLHQSIETLSKGFKRRVGLAQAILHDPPVLILDEPTDGLDPNQKKEVRQLITDMAQEKVIILSTHILEEVDAVCSRAIIIAAGKIVADDTPGDLEQKSQHYNALSLKLKGVEPAQAVKQLASIAGVARVEQSGDQAEPMLTLFPKNKKNLVADVHKFLTDTNWEVDEFHVDKGRLDDVFTRITQPEQSLT